mgnify:CR=1 FL=1
MSILLKVKDQYVDVYELPDPFTVSVILSIVNNEGITLYFKAKLVNPPSGYSNYEKTLGSVGAGASVMKAFSFDRSQPTLTNGELSETLTLRVEAYRDSGYTNLYDAVEKNFTINYLNREDPAFTKIIHNNFDDGTKQGWLSGSGGIFPKAAYNLNNVVSYHYYSPSYALKNYESDKHQYKSVDTSGYSKAFLIIHLFRESGYDSLLGIKVGNKVLLLPEESEVLPYNTWCKLVFPLPIGSITIKLGATSSTYVDDIIVACK